MNRISVIPEVTPLTAPYWEAAARGELLLQECSDCGRCWHPPQPCCPSCQGFEYVWRPTQGGGVVYSFTIVHHATHLAFNDKIPYLVALIELPEGVRIVSTVRNCPISEVRVGMPVRVMFRDSGAGIVLPEFEPGSA